MTDPVLRNLWITQRYHELAVQLREAGAGKHATWCAFAVWASKSAGSTIRGEDLPVRVRTHLGGSETMARALHEFNRGMEKHLLARLEHGHLFKAVNTVSSTVASTIADGNVLVFSELAPLFTAMVQAWTGPRPPDSAACGTTLAPALSDLSGKGVDTTPLQEAFDLYWQALGQAQDIGPVMLAANVLAVSHEQTRLQPDITAALNAAIDVEFERVVDQEIGAHVAIPGVQERLSDATTGVSSVLERAWRTALTELIMQLVTADEVLDLRQDVPPLQGAMFPGDLADLDGTPAAPAVARWDRTGGTGVPSRTHDWSVMEERMNYIVTLFRSRQLHPALFTAPFNVDQLTQLSAGHRPDGPL